MKKHLALVGACLVLGSCTLFHSTSHLEPGDVPSKMTSVALTNSASKVWPDQGWWKGFASDELDGLIAQAEQNNLDIVIARTRVEQADAQARIAGSALLPSITGSVKAGQTGSLHTSSSDVKSLSASVGVSYEVDFWGRNFENARAADSALLASVYDQETVALTTVAGVADTYFRLLSLRDRVKLTQLNVDNATKLLALTQKQYDVGLVSKLPLAQQSSLLASLKAQAASLELQERQTFGALAILMGKPPQDFSVGAQTLEGLSLPTVSAGLPSDLLSRRPDVKSAEANLEAAQADLAAARAAFLPTVSLTGDAGVASTALSGLLAGSNAAYTIGAALVQTIFHGGQLIAQDDQAYARREQLLASYRKSAITAFSDVDQALVAVSTATVQEEQQTLAASSAAEALRLAQAQYKAGTADFLTVLSAQQTYYSAQDQLAQVKASRLQATVDLFRALGGGWTAGN